MNRDDVEVRRGRLAHELAKRKLLDHPIGDIASDELWACIDAALAPEPDGLPEYDEWLPEVWEAYLRELGCRDEHGWAKLPANFRWFEFWDRLRPAIRAALANIAPESPLTELQRLGQEFDAPEPVDAGLVEAVRCAIIQASGDDCDTEEAAYYVQCFQRAGIALTKDTSHD